ncbi:MAG: TadE family protein [Planctomycetota bacterium]
MAVEMALVTPLLMTMVLGIIEYGWAFTVRHSLVAAAREGARVAALPGSTEQQVRDRVAGWLQPLNLENYTVTLTRATPEVPIETVQLQVPFSEVTLVANYFGISGNLSATCSMRKEGPP